jgi:hypothetical protein
MQHKSWAAASLLGACFIASLSFTSCASGEAPTQAQCDGWSNQASAGRRQAQDDAERTCNTDADCTLVDYGLSCFADCGYPSAVARSSVPALEAEVRSLDDQLCGRFESEECPGPIIPPCVAPVGTPAARCQSGVCSLERVEQP